MIESEKITQRNHRWMIAALIFGGLLVAGSLAVALVLLLASSSSGSTGGQPDSLPAVVEPIGDTGLSRVILTEKAAERLGIQTAPVRDAEAVREGSSGNQAIPYSAILYATNGDTFVYTSPEPLTFVRAPITVDYIDGDVVVLSDGPSSGTAVVTVGSAELFGAEFEFEE